MRLRMGGSGWSRGRRALAVGFVLALAGFAGACGGAPTDTLDQTTTADASEADFSIVFGDLTEGLGLTDDQIEAVRSVLEEYRGQGRQPGQLWYAAADLQGILTSDQIAAIEERQTAMRAEMKARRDGMRGRFSGGPLRGHGRGMGSIRGGIRGGNLDLSDEQITELGQIRGSFAPQLREIRDGVRSGSISRDEARTRVRGTREALHEALTRILTDEQIAVLDEHRADAKGRREEMRSRWEGRHEAAQAAMVEAVGLTADQVDAIGALGESLRSEGRPLPEEAEAGREARHQALLDILDNDQAEIWILHGSLSRLVARHQARGRMRDGMRDGFDGGPRGGFGGPPAGP